MKIIPTAVQRIQKSTAWDSANCMYDLTHKFWHVVFESCLGSRDFGIPKCYISRCFLYLFSFAYCNYVQTTVKKKMWPTHSSLNTNEENGSATIFLTILTPWSRNYVESKRFQRSRTAIYQQILVLLAPPVGWCSNFIRSKRSNR